MTVRRRRVPLTVADDYAIRDFHEEAEREWNAAVARLHATLWQKISPILEAHGLPPGTRGHFERTGATLEFVVATAAEQRDAEGRPALELVQ